MKAFVTGAAGFIGSHLCDFLVEKGCRVTGIDNFSDYYARSIKEENLNRLMDQDGFVFHEGALQDTNLTRLLRDVDIVFHQSAQAGVRASWGKSFRIYTDSNVLATQILLEQCKELGIKKFVYASSSSIYGDTTDLPMRESSLPRPVSPYGVSKLAAEHLCWLYHKNFGVPTVSLRYFTVFGPRQRPDMAFHRFFKWALEGKSLKVYGDGRQTRDFTYVQDIIEANWLAAEKAMPGEVFNIGGGSRISLNEVIGMIQDMVGTSLDVRYQGTQQGDVRHTSADMTKAREMLGYAPKISVEEGLKAEHQWIRRLMGI